jgi:hypothetical protein
MLLVDDVRIIGYVWLVDYWKMYYMRILEFCVCFLLVWVWGVGSINGVWWFVAIEKCLERLVEFTESEIGGI